MHLKLAVPDGLQTNLNPLHPNRSAAQQTMQSLIMQDDHQLTVRNRAVLNSNGCFIFPRRERDHSQGQHQAVDGR